MSVKLCESAQEFLDETLALRTQNALSLNMIGSVATSVARGDRSYDRYFWWVVKDEFGKVVGLAMRTAPHAMVLSQMPLPAIIELVDQVVALDDDLPEIGGPNEIVDQFISTYQAKRSPGSKRKAELSHQELLYELRGLKKPEVSGKVRAATKEDFELIHEWFLAFGDEAGILLHNTIESIEDGLKRASLFLWIDGGKIVSMAGHAPVVEIPGAAIARIGPVYTPPAQRRKGYAGALTAHISQKLLDQGAQVILYTDAANPTSNGVYQRIGFEKIDESKRVKFLAP